MLYFVVLMWCADMVVFPTTYIYIYIYIYIYGALWAIETQLTDISWVGVVWSFSRGRLNNLEWTRCSIESWWPRLEIWHHPHPRDIRKDMCENANIFFRYLTHALVPSIVHWLIVRAYLNFLSICVIFVAKRSVGSNLILKRHCQNKF